MSQPIIKATITLPFMVIDLASAIENESLKSFADAPDFMMHFVGNETSRKYPVIFTVSKGEFPIDDFELSNTLKSISEKILHAVEYDFTGDERVVYKPQVGTHEGLALTYRSLHLSQHPSPFIDASSSVINPLTEEEIEAKDREDFINGPTMRQLVSGLIAAIPNEKQEERTAGLKNYANISLGSIGDQVASLVFRMGRHNEALHVTVTKVTNTSAAHKESVASFPALQYNASGNQNTLSLAYTGDNGEEFMIQYGFPQLEMADWWPRFWLTDIVMSALREEADRVHKIFF